ncbi:iron ABC transporter permease [Affinibrenneria salicis]|uniref:Iron ABC transporter permease n=1 Tax=Affinibrenneria salicis TaxID=2590031 RepID=A0A5J5G1R5_9GAMM|nr:iron ABC transporter permease [Affinibrenneria salicis]KAA9000509.1 iron ABC transporter permease [Affinibrenneria salicis]
MTSLLSASRPRRARRALSNGAALLLALAALLLLSLVQLGLGARYIDPFTVCQALIAYDAHNFDHTVIVELRLLRLIAALLVGAGLGIAGVLLQAVIRNPLGEPHILGLNAGAALAVVIGSAVGASGSETLLVRPLLAACGAAVLFLCVMLLASAGRSGLTPLKVTLCGVALSSFASSITAAILILDEQTLLDMRIWLVGDLAGLSWPILRAAAVPMLPGALLALYIAPRLNVLALGDIVASGLGVNIARTRLLGLIAAALLCGCAVSIAGPIGFIGLVVPHIVRRLFTDDIRMVIPLSAVIGALLLLIADIAARTLVAPQELATGVMTALVGAPVFILIASRLFK